jgi:signal transduction histidine kinase
MKPQLKIKELKSKLEEQIQRVKIISEVGAALSSVLDLDNLLLLIMEKVTEIMEAERSTLYIIDKEKQELWSKVIQGEELKEIRLKIGEGIAGWVAEKGEILNIKEAYKSPLFDSSWDKKSGFKTNSVLCTPIKNNLNQLIGVIQVINKKRGYFTLEDQDLLKGLGGQIAITIENSILFSELTQKNIELIKIKERLEQKIKELNLLFEIEQSISQAFDLDEFLQGIITKATSLLSCKAGSILILKKDTNEMYFLSATGKDVQALKRLYIPPRKGICSWVATSGKPLLTNDVTREPRYYKELGEKIGYSPKSILCVPLKSDDRIIGAFEVLDKDAGKGNFTSEDLKLLSLIGAPLGRVIERFLMKEARMKEERLMTVGRLLSGILHDLKTPMTIISGYVELMAPEEDPTTRTKYAEMVLQQFDYINSMTGEVLAFIKGQRNLLIRKIYIQNFIEKIKEQLTREFKAKNIEFIVKTRYKGTAMFDEGKISRVFHNIASNAIDAMPNGGRFTVEITRQRDNLLFSFSDTGNGIPPEIEGRIFESFVSKKQNGSGLGLAIVKKIVEDHNGKITYKTSPSKGTTFYISLPIHKQK